MPPQTAPQPLTYAQLQQMGASPVAQPQAPQPMTFAQLQQMGATPVQQQNPLVAGVEGVVSGAVSAVKSGAQAIGATVAQNAKKQGSPMSPLDKTGSEIATGADLAGEISSLPFEAIGGAAGALVPHQIKQAAGTALEGTADAITSNPQALYALDTVNSLIDQHPQIAQLLSGLGTAAFNLASGETGGEGATAAVDTASDVASSAAGAVKDALPAAPTAADHIASVQQDWERPLAVKNNSYNAARKVVAKNPEATPTLANMGIDPSAYVQDGKYDTEELAQEVREAAGTQSSEQLRPALQLADTYTAPAQVSDIEKTAIDAVNADSGITPASKLKVIANIKNETQALATANPDGLTLSGAHDAKITYGQNSGYSPINDPAANNIATANRYLRDALAKDVENRAPASLPVHQVNSDLHNAYSAADFLQALNNKKAPASFAQKVARGAAKFGGAAIANHLPFVGGDLISDFAGYQIGKYIESALENMSHPDRARYLANMEKYEPASYKALQAFIEKNKAGNPEIPRLMAPSEPISPINNGNPIPVIPGGGTYTGSQTVAQTAP